MRALSVILIALLTTTLFAADVDLSGTWKLNEDKSELADFQGRRGGFIAPGMVVKQQQDKLTVERTLTGRDGEERTMETVYDLTGKTTKEEVRRGTTEHTATWEGETLKIKTKRSMQRRGESFDMITHATWTLVDDGKALVIESTSDTPMGEQTYKSYYVKQ